MINWYQTENGVAAMKVWAQLLRAKCNAAPFDIIKSECVRRGRMIMFRG